MPVCVFGIEQLEKGRESRKERLVLLCVFMSIEIHECAEKPKRKMKIKRLNSYHLLPVSCFNVPKYTGAATLVPKPRIPEGTHQHGVLFKEHVHTLAISYQNQHQEPFSLCMEQEQGFNAMLKTNSRIVRNSAACPCQQDLQGQRLRPDPMSL